MKDSSYVEWSENLDAFQNIDVGYTTKNSADPFTLLNQIVGAPVVLILTGALTAFLSYFTSEVNAFGSEVRRNFIGNMYDPLCFLSFVFWCVGAAALSCAFTQWICPEAVGGGLPEMKTILSGTIKPVLLSMQMIIGKTLGLSLALLSGIAVGKEGPFVLISAAIADQLMRLPLFRNIRLHDAKRLEILGCACASGVTSVFGTAFGGALFSIEFTSSAYDVKTLPKAFLTSVCVMLVFAILGVSDKLSLGRDIAEDMSPQSDQTPQLPPQLHLDKHLDETRLGSNSSLRWLEYGVFIAVGTICGLLGVLFVWMVEFITVYKNRLLDNSRFPRVVIWRRRMALTCTVVFVLSSLMYVEMATAKLASADSDLSQRTLMELIFLPEPSNVSQTQMIKVLLLYFPYKLITVALSVTLPLPVGLFTPVFLVGGVIGRLIGEVLSLLQQRSDFALLSRFTAADIAVVGAAAFSSGVTRAMSTAVIVYEISGNQNLRLPLSVAILAAYFIGNRISKNVYDVLIDRNGTPYMQALPKELYFLAVSDAMIPVDESHVLSLESTYSDAIALLSDEVRHKIFGNQHPPLRFRGGFNGSDRARSFSTSEYPSQNRSRDGENQDMENKGQRLYPDGLIPPYSLGNENGRERDGNGLGGRASRGNGTASADVDETAAAERRRWYLREPVIPVVQSYQSMVIVGAVKREDIVTAICRLKNISSIAAAAPLVLGLENDELDIESPISVYERRRINERSYFTKKDTIQSRTNGTTSEEGPSRRTDHSPSLHLTEERRTDKEDEDASLERGSLGHNNELRINGGSSRLGSTTDPSTLDFPRTPIAPRVNTVKLCTSPLSDEEENIFDQRIHYVTVAGKVATPVVSASRSRTGRADSKACWIGQRETRKSLLWRGLDVVIYLDPSPYQVVSTMHLSKVDMVFRLLKLSQAYVTRSGRLIGVITRSRLREYLEDTGMTRRPLDRISHFFSALKTWTVNVFQNCMHSHEGFEYTAISSMPPSRLPGLSAVSHPVSETHDTTHESSYQQLGAPQHPTPMAPLINPIGPAAGYTTD